MGVFSLANEIFTTNCKSLHCRCITKMKKETLFLLLTLSNFLYKKYDNTFLANSLIEFLIN